MLITVKIGIIILSFIKMIVIMLSVVILNINIQSDIMPIVIYIILNEPHNIDYH